MKERKKERKAARKKERKKGVRKKERNIKKRPVSQAETRRTQSVLEQSVPLAQHSTIALWSRITKNPDVSTGPLARPFACSLAPLTHLLALHCSWESE